MKIISLFVFCILTVILFADPVDVTVRADGDGLISVNGSGFEKEINIQCEPDTEINVQINSMNNFKGWGGFGDATTRSITPTKQITVGSEPMTITAYFLNNIKNENIILNGDLELNKDHNHNVNGTTDLSILTAGTWNIENISQDYSYYRCNINRANNGKNPSYATNTKAYTIGGLSYQLSTHATNKEEGMWYCEVNAPCGGLYTFSLVLARCYRDKYIGSNYWKLKVELEEKKTNKVIEIGFFDVNGGKAAWVGPFESQQFNIPRGGVYKLKLRIPWDTRYNEQNNYLIMCMDNLELKLKKRFGFSVNIR